MLKKVSHKVVALVLAVVVLTAGSALLAAQYFISAGFEGEAQRSVDSSTRAVDTHIAHLQDKLAIAAASVGTDPRSAEAIKLGNAVALKPLLADAQRRSKASFAFVCDAKGQILASTDDKASEGLGSVPSLTRALGGMASSGFDEGIGKSLFIDSAHPIAKDGVTVGAVFMAFDFSADFSVVDECKRMLGIETTIFRGDTRISTTIIKAGSRAVGTKMDNPVVISTVLQKGDRYETANQILGTDYSTAYWPIRSNDGKVIGMLFLGRNRAAIAQASNNVTFGISIVTLLSGALATLLGIALGRSISSPLVRGTGLAKELADGRLGGQIAISTKDEIGELAGALNAVSQRLSEVISGVKDAASQAGLRAKQLSQASDGLASDATEQAAAVEEVSASMEQMSSSVQQNAANALSTANLVTKAAADTRKGAAAVLRTQEAMLAISSKISIIDEIARQTNLLALNAAIEAARAGTVGLGFAVVAAEVRRLAERSRNAAQEIMGLSENSTRIASEAGVLLSSILPQVEKTSLLVQEISIACKEQSQGIHQIDHALHSLDEAIQHNAASSEELASTATELLGQANDLENNTEFFTTKTTASLR